MKGIAFLSAFMGFFFGLAGYFVLLLFHINQPFQLAVLSGLLFALLLFAFLGGFLGSLIGSLFAFLFFNL